MKNLSQDTNGTYYLINFSLLTLAAGAFVLKVEQWLLFVCLVLKVNVFSALYPFPAHFSFDIKK